MKTLILVNYQNDYLTGTLGTKGAQEILPEIKKFIKDNHKDIEKIIFIMDWHPYNHCSFKRGGGEMPQHCIQFTPGACIEPKLLKFIQSYERKCEYDLLGEYEEFRDKAGCYEIEFVQDALGDRYYFDNIGPINSNTEFIICGIGDKVLSTLQNLNDARIYTKLLEKATYTQDKKLDEYVKDLTIEKI